MNYIFQRVNNKSYGIMKIFGTENQFKYYTQLLLIPNKDWEEKYLKVNEFKQEDIFKRLCMIDVLLNKVIYPKYKKMQIINKNEWTLMEKCLEKIIDYPLINYGYSCLELINDNSVECKLIKKMLSILVEKNMIKLFKEVDKNIYVIIITENLFKVLDEGFDGFRTVCTNRIDNYYINEIYKVFRDSKEYFNCYVKTTSKLIIKN